MGSALRNTPPPEPAPNPAANSHASAHTPAHTSDALRLEVAERLAAHRNRRGQLHPQPPAAPSSQPAPATTRSARIAQTVAEHYAQALSYRAFLAAEADRATQQAKAAAEIAARNAQAVAEAEQRLLNALYAEAQAEAAYKQAHAEQLTLVEAPEMEGAEAERPNPQLATDPSGPSFPVPSERMGYRAKARPSSPASRQSQIPARSTTADTPATHAPGLTVHLFAEAAPTPLALPAALNPRQASRRQSHADEAEARALDEEISFRHTPIFEEPAGPPMPLPANLIEFPRQLVAPRKVRPRYAEGPLREDDDLASSGSQLRIFEVEPEQISTTPDVAEEAPTPQWTSLWLDAPHFAAATAQAARTTGELPSGEATADPIFAPYAITDPARYPAALPRRLMAATLDAGVIAAAFLAASATIVWIALHAAGEHLRQLPALTIAVLTGRAGLPLSMILAASAAGLVFLYLLYQLLFFSLSEATPGMRCARIALCTFTDDNPTRSAMRRRILAVLLSACPFGLGFLWAALDEDRLTWHDLISRTYQRSY